MSGRLKYAAINLAALGSLLFAIPCLLIAGGNALFLSTSFGIETIATAVVQGVKDECWLQRSETALLGVNFDKNRLSVIKLSKKNLCTRRLI
jgi:hypothetical protein